MPSENGLSRREELLTVATKLFAARGYHGTRMDDVADVVGLNKATVYHYYASKSLILYDNLSARPPNGRWPPCTTIRRCRPVRRSTNTRCDCSTRSPPTQKARRVYFQEQPYITEWFHRGAGRRDP